MVKIIGHRGCKDLEPENTLRAFRRAIRLGIYGVEMDVHLSKDNVPVIMHDARLERTTNSSGTVAEKTLAQLKTLDAGEGESVPTLQDAIDVCKRNAVMFIELKSPSSEKIVVDLLEKNAVVNDSVIISFQKGFLAKVKEINPDITTGLLYLFPLLKPENIARSVRADLLCPNRRLVSAEMVERAKSEGLEVMAWNVDDEYEFKKMKTAGVKYIGTNRPDLLVRLDK